MNGLALRISRGGGVKSKNSIGFSPTVIPASFFGNTADDNTHIQAFINSTSTDDQLDILKKLVTNIDLKNDNVNLLVIAFLQSEAKHPVKCFISRHITKNKHLQQPFTDALVQHIAARISNTASDYKQYVDIVNKVAMCIENFNAGVAAVRVIEAPLAAYLHDCLECCMKMLREKKSLSPTEKNEIFVLGHLTLRLLLHIVQKANSDSNSQLILMSEKIRLIIQELMFDDDVPMDTKSVCGILYLSMHVMENGAESWTDVLNANSTSTALKNLLNLEAARLSLYSAIVTVVSVDQLSTKTGDNGSAIVTLTGKILAIGERSSSESAFILGVSRTLLQISKLLEKIPDRTSGIILVDSLLLFAWSHLEHYMDSVRHLAGQMLGCVVKYCAKLDRDGDPTALNMLTAAVASLDRSRKSFYLTVSWLAGELGASRVMRLCVDIHDVIAALDSQPVHNTASTALETLLEKYSSECTAEELNSVWLQPILQRARRHLDSAVLAGLESLLVKAFKLHPTVVQYIIPYIQEVSKSEVQNPCDLKCILMLLRVARKSGVTDKLSAHTSENEWKGIISYDVLRQAAIDAVDEIRVLSLSLIVESPKSTEVFTEGDLRFVLYYLRYNINAQAPSFRQLTLSVMKKFMKRLEESYKVIKRQKQPNNENDKVDYYLRFMEHLRRQCFDCLIPGANYSRRFVALQILVWCEQITLEGYERSWEVDYVEKLLLHLEDSYENNKAFASEVLPNCPIHLLKTEKFSISLELKDIFRQASSLKPTDCVSAAYKLDFLRKRLPEHILQDEQCTAVDPVTFTLLSKLLSAVQSELSICEQSVVCAAGRAPIYGLLHCLGHVLEHVEPQAISTDDRWKCLIANVITTCVAVNAAVASVVNNSSPEGHLPMDMSVQLTDYGNSGNVRLCDGRQVTAQMVLLCAWRSVKEVSLLLGTICSRLSISGEGEATGTLSVSQVSIIGDHFTSLLAETKHRGAFEQAYVGFTKLLARLWRCRSPALHSLPRGWLRELMQAIASAQRSAALCATRRSAGLPFMIQALVTTELQVQGNPGCFHDCMSSLLQLAQSSCEESRTHALNILRALFRNAALDQSVAPYVGDGLLVALRGFEGDTWAERNSSTLLFSALMVRVFGVQRSRDAERLCVRNRMTGRIFFLRYPQLYDFMLEKLKEVSMNAATQVLPSLYPVLLLLARLYPSSLEGTVSNLKIPILDCKNGNRDYKMCDTSRVAAETVLVAYIPHVLSCANSSVMKTRQLAAKAIVPLISPEQYITHIQSMFKLIHNENIKKNYCHGILLQLVRILDAKPEKLKVEEADLEGCVEGTLWVLRQASGKNPCYLIIDELVKVINLVVWRFPTLPQETITNISKYLHVLIFHTVSPTISPGRDICLSNAIYLYFILETKFKSIEICDLVYKGLEHPSNEVILSVLNYLLILHDDLEVEFCKFQEHLMSIADRTTLDNIKNERYIQLLCKVLKNDYLECQQKSLKILVLEGNTQRFIIETKINEKVTDEMVIEKLLDCIQNEHENLTHIYLESLLNFVTDRLKESGLCERVLLDVIRVVFEYSSADNSENSRIVVVRFLEKHIEHLLSMNTNQLSEAESFELQATIWVTVITLLEDDEDMIRQRISDVLCPLSGTASRLAPGACAALLRGGLHPGGHGTHGGHGPRGAALLWGGGAPGPRGAALLAVIALLDFKSAVVLTDDVSEECRVFDQNERYNIFLEETVWTNACADIIVNDFKITDVLPLIDNPLYKGTFDKLCKDNVEVFKKMVSGHKLPRSDALNPKIELFVNKLSAEGNTKNVCY